MDSMRSLDTSLPGASPSKSSSDSPEQLLDCFKAAALAVTKLYKTAASDKGKARAEGYQDALDDLLSFLDKEDIGLSDGEGWRVRAWATERLDGRDSVSQNMESEDESGEKVDHSISPEISRSHSAVRSSNLMGAPTTSSAQMESETPPQIITPSSTPTASESNPIPPPPGIFTFRSSYAYPQDPDITLSDLDLSDGNRTQNHDGSGASHVSNPPINVTRSSRTNARPNIHSGRLSGRTGNPFPRSTDKKRKLNMADFFDISTSGHGKDGFSGGGKRGRFT